MIPTSCHRRRLNMLFVALRSICLVLLALCSVVSQAMAFQIPSFKDADRTNPSTVQPYDKACVTCHDNLDPQAQHQWIGLHQASTFFGFDPEKKTYVQDQRDIHARALSKVFEDGDKNGPLTKAFEEILRVLEIQKDSEPFRSQCLTCHAGLRPDADHIANPGRTWAQFQAEDEPIARESIGCEACHGQGKGYLVDHIYSGWLTSSTSFKLGKGFYDLENSAIAARVCLSCHLGSPEESKVITHEMYAAGHPPLPPVDLAKFLDETCSKHWTTLSEKSNKLSTLKSPIDLQLENARVAYLRNHLSTDSPDLNQTIQVQFRKTQQSRIGQMTANLIHHDLLLNQAQSDTNWGDYALYDCAGCHQTLYKKIRGSVGSPGRVPGRPLGLLWTKSMLSSSEESQLAPLLPLQGLIDQELNAKPFGDRSRIQAAIDGFASERANAKLQLIDLASQPFDQASAEQWLRGFLQQRRSMLGNQWVAKQTFWTLEMFFDDLAIISPSNIPQESNDRIFQARFEQLKSDAPRFSQLVSCGELASKPRSTGDDAAFYELLEAFIDDFLNADQQASP
ncbi:MAG: hypothetical protein NTV29_05790 [Planctomycetota bacterium]|nr:hypothetical protein [Planctomycetota bacterium]